jgi:hypothetical protein
MGNAANAKKISMIKKEKRERPDGTDLSRYKNIEKWSYKKWAWEFLCRNNDFIAACKKIESSVDQKNEIEAVAKQFGLKSFKSCTEKYKGESGYPQFSMGSISSWTNLDAEKDKKRQVSIRICAGQVVIRFNLVSAIEDRKSLDKQIRLAEIRLKNRLVSYEKLIQKEAKTHKYKVINFGIYIRLLDYMDKGKSPLECAKLVFPSKVADSRTDNYLRMDVKDPIKAANKLANEGYLYLSVLKGRPKAKCIRLEI